MGVTAGYALGTMLSYGALAELMSGKGPEEDETVPEWLLRKAVGSAFLLLPFGGDISEAVQYAIAPEGSMRKPSERSSPAVAAFEHMRNALGTAFNENADDLDRYIAAGELLAFGARLPVVQPKRTLKYALDPSDTSPAGVASGVVYGERDGQPANPLTIGRSAGRHQRETGAEDQHPAHGVPLEPRRSRRHKQELRRRRRPERH
jgi:hypothetical protein